MTKTLNKKDLFWIFVRSNFLLGSFNFERMQAMGFCVSLIPALKKLYQGDELKAALKRHLEFFNTQPFLGAAIMGIIAAMEEKRANGADISQQTLSGVKVGLIGPLAGVGDPIFWGTLRPVLAALGAGIALTGSILGPIIFFIAFNALRLLTHWYGVMYGYSKGTELVEGIGGNKMRYLTEGSSVLGRTRCEVDDGQYAARAFGICERKGRGRCDDSAVDSRQPHARDCSASHDVRLYVSPAEGRQSAHHHSWTLCHRHCRLCHRPACLNSLGVALRRKIRAAAPFDI